MVQADVTVVIDYLGLNGAADSSNILIVGTEDGTSSGTAHAFRLTSNGAVIIDDGGQTISVDATDLDIRDLDHANDSVKIGDGAEFLAINADGSINTNATVSSEGTEEFNASDDLAAGGDGLIDITAGGFIDVCSIAIGAGETGYLYGYSGSADGNAVVRVVTVDGANTVVYKLGQTTTSMPNVFEHFGKDGRIEIAGTATLSVRVQVRSKGNGSSSADSAFGSLHVRKV